MYKWPIKILLILIAFTLIFHLCFLFKIIPYNIAWGGRLKTDNEMYVFESLSIMVNLFLGRVILMKGDYIKKRYSEENINIILKVFMVIFILNTIGNLLAITNFEKLFSIVTAGLAFLIWKAMRIRPETHLSDQDQIL